MRNCGIGLCGSGCEPITAPYENVFEYLLFYKMVGNI
jgi:hypothetical protein